MRGTPGKTNNPNGRPPKSRALTYLLDRALSKKLSAEDGSLKSGKFVISSLIADAVVTGRIKFPGDTEASVISIKDWIEFVKWVYQYLEPPVTRQELTGKDGGDVVIKVRLTDEDD